MTTHLGPRLAAAGLAGIVLAAPAAALTVAEWSKAFAAPTVAGAGVDAAGTTLNYGHLALSFAAGRLLPVVVSDRVVGAYFAGQGSFRYVSGDPFEAPTYRTNVARCSGFRIDKDGAIGGAITEVLLMLSAGAEQLTGAAGGRSGESPPGQVATFAAHLERFAQDRGSRYRQLMPQALVERTAEPLVMAEIRSAHGDLHYVLDPIRDLDEYLSVMEKTKSDISFLKDRRYPNLLSEQPLGRPRLEPRPKRVMLTSLDVTVVNPEGLRAEVEAKETFQVLQPTTVLALSLWSERFGAVGAAAKLVMHDYTVKGVRLAGGEDLPFSHVDNDLLVELPRAYAPGEQVTITCSIAGDVLFNPGNDSYWELPTSSWYPAVQLEEQYLTYHAVVKVRKPFVAFSCGATVRRWEEGGLSCAEFRETRPIQIPVVLAGRYTTVSEERNGVTVRVSSYVMADKGGLGKLVKNAFALMEFYQPFLGPYPFVELNIIEINSYGFGQAPAGIIFLTKEAFTPLQDETSRLFSQGVNARVAHEMAHAWWGHVAKLTDQDQWISEALAQYYAAFAMGRLHRDDEFRRAMDEWRGWSRFVKDNGSVYMANYLSGDRAGEDRNGLLYGKGPLVLHALRRELGDDAFFTVFKSFLKSFNFKYGETRHIIGLINFVTKKDYQPFFDRYVFGTEWPKD
jgi:hypothetical protein